MVRKLTIYIIFLVCIPTYWSCDCLPWEECNGEYKFKNNYEDAVNQINYLKSKILEQASNNAIGLRSLQSAHPCEIWILNDCDNSIQNYAETITDRFPDKEFDYDEDALNTIKVTFDWSNSWTVNNTLKSDIKYELLEIIFESIAEKSEIYGLNVSISLINTQIKRIRNAAIILNEYEDLLNSINQKADGNIFISAIIKGQLQIEYKAFNKKGEKIKLNLAGDVNELLDNLSWKPGYQYFREKSSSSEFSIIEESGDYLTVFAVEYFPVKTSLQDLEHISNMITEFCDNDGIAPRRKKIAGICSSSGRSVVDLTLEVGEDGKRWYTFWANKIDRTITYCTYSLTVRNKFNQILDRFDSFIYHDVSPGATLESGEISYLSFGISPDNFYNLFEVELKLQISAATSNTEDVCQ